MMEVLQYEFMRNALLAGLLASIACGVIGTLVVVNRIVFLAGGIAHAAYGGVGLALFMGLASHPGSRFVLRCGLDGHGSRKHRQETSSRYAHRSHVGRRLRRGHRVYGPYSGL